MKLWICISVLGLCGAPVVGRAQDEAEQRAKEIEAVCGKAHCRDARTVSVRLEDGSTFERAVPRLPIVLPNGWITVYPGEEIHVELTLAQGTIKSARAVAKPVRRDATLTFKLSQPQGRADTVLDVSHALPRNIKYSLGMMLPSGGQLYATTSCPVQPGLTSHETWAHPVFQVVIRDLRLLPEGASLNCDP
ncbi:MAG: hypothetical protein QOD26_4273 [Betaproteobacteria bacterium]|jgi:hypothetical protein|nr:hypothetical protein [Betaproteobacteria bacterium]